MATTEFLDALNAVEDDDYTAEIVDWLQNVKGVANARSTLLGWELDPEDVKGATRYYFAIVDDGLLEVMVRRRSNGTITRRVVDFSTDPMDLVDVLGAERMTETMKSRLAEKLDRDPVLGQKLTGVVTSVRDDIGIFVRVRDGVTGLVMPEGLPDEANHTPSLAANVGDKIDVRVARAYRGRGGVKRWEFTMRGPIN